VTNYTIYIAPRAWDEIKQLPGNIRQRARKAIDHLANDPRPGNSTELDRSELPEIEAELRRLRLEKWRIVYTVSETEAIVDILGVRKRPPYDYGDLAELLEEYL